MKKLLFFALSSNLIFSQINPENIDIVRDSYGVPHIFAKTDAEVSYGLAWAHAEDDFETIQLAFLAGNSMLSNHLGSEGAPADFISKFIGSKEIVDKKYNEISDEYKLVLEGYALGLNSYAKKFPDKVLYKKLFPLTPKMMLRYGQLQLFIRSKGGEWVGKILSDKTQEDYIDQNLIGSNFIAMNSSKTKSGESFLVINTHQPLEGPTSWYEAHINSEEGTNILGTLYPGTPHILIGVNENLGWSHTFNNLDIFDVYKLEMTKGLKYIVDGEEYKLEKDKAKIKIKILGLKIPINRKFYKSIFGPTLKNKKGFYSIRAPILHSINALEQWWRMGKAKNFNEFYSTLKMKGLTGVNIAYADKYDTIFYMSDGLIPKREEGYNWKEIVPGNTKKTLWTETYDIEDLPQVIQPKSGYIYNANHSPFKSTSNDENPNPNNFNPDMGFELFDNNRSIRLKKLIDEKDKISYEEFRKIKNDNSFPEKLSYSFMDINPLFEISLDSNHELKNMLDILQSWDRKTDIDSVGAGIYGVLYYHLLDKYRGYIFKNRVLSEEVLLSALKEVKSYIIKNFGYLEITLGDFQKLVRGNIELPIWGLPDVVTTMVSTKYKDGKRRVFAGESYIGYIRFNEDGPIIESVISYGNSEVPESKHYDDQMKLYQNFKLKKVSMDKEEIYKNASKIYNPN
ncbi:MAG: penicillin acylase family protein [Bacteroidota bacterium]|nr:penicillin acylase family protein [Bacteroidota bacterium]